MRVIWGFVFGAFYRIETTCAVSVTLCVCRVAVGKRQRRSLAEELAALANPAPRGESILLNCILVSS